MFGWEFPPHISGGLGTACFGLTKSLVNQNVGITFVLPRIKGERTSSHVELLGAADLVGPVEVHQAVVVEVARLHRAVSTGGAEVDAAAESSAEPPAEEGAQAAMGRRVDALVAKQQQGVRFEGRPDRREALAAGHRAQVDPGDRHTEAWVQGLRSHAATV